MAAPGVYSPSPFPGPAVQTLFDLLSPRAARPPLVFYGILKREQKNGRLAYADQVRRRIQKRVNKEYAPIGDFYHSMRRRRAERTRNCTTSCNDVADLEWTETAWNAHQRFLKTPHELPAEV